MRFINLTCKIARWTCISVRGSNDRSKPIRIKKIHSHLIIIIIILVFSGIIERQVLPYGNELVALSEELKAFIPAFPTSLAKEWKRPTLISANKRYYFVALNLQGIASSSSKRDRDYCLLSNLYLL
jgi:hypothetical protein